MLLVLNLGVTEIILAALSIIFLIGFVFAIYFLLKMIFIKEKSSFPIYGYSVNVVTNAPVQKKDKTVLIEPDPLKEKQNFKEKQNSKIALPQQTETRYVDVSQIIRCEADDNYTKFVLDGESILISRSLKEYADLLKPAGFMRTHQSHLVNHAYVKSWLKEDGGVLLLFNGDKIPVSKPNKDLVKEILGGYFIS